MDTYETAEGLIHGGPVCPECGESDVYKATVVVFSGWSSRPPDKKQYRVQICNICNHEEPFE